MLSPLRCLPVLLLSLAVSAPVPAQDAKSAPVGQLAAKLQPFVDSHTLAGAVLLVANRDGVLATETVGHADIAASGDWYSATDASLGSESDQHSGSLKRILGERGTMQA